MQLDPFARGRRVDPAALCPALGFGDPLVLGHHDGW